MGNIPKICPRCAHFLKRGEKKCPECGMSFVDEKTTEEKSVNNGADFKENTPKKQKKEKKKKVYNHQPVKLDFEAQEDKTGKININTDDVTFTKPTAPRSVKEARGDTIPEKLKWWEIYKWADRMLARRKIKKYVNQASTEIPENISNTKMFFLCLFLGWIGIHNLYAKNFVRGFVVMGMMIVATVVISVDVLNSAVGVSIGGGFGFVVLFMWMLDLIRIITKKYRFRISKEKFVNKLNFSTRAKLGRKYIKNEIKEMESKNAA